MPFPVDSVVLWIAILLILSIFISKAVSKFAIPALLIFVAIGMFVGSEGPGGVYFDDPWEAQLIGTFALAVIIFTGGLQTKWSSVRPILREGIILSIAAVLLTAVLVGWLITIIFKIPLIYGLLLGAIISSTDAPAVFALLRAKSMRLKPKLSALLEFESGSNDPMAVFLTMALLYKILHPSASASSLVTTFIQQFVLGVMIGYAMAHVTVFILNKLILDHDGFYQVLMLSAVFFTYGITTAMGGSGFLAVYVMGIVMGQKEFARKTSLINFHDGFSWLMHIAMFLVMGLLVFPSRLITILQPALIISGLLMFIGRPVSVFLTLTFSKLNIKEKTMVSWVGMRGAVPIVLAIFPMVQNIPFSEKIFDCVFCIVIISVLVQGATIPLLARLLKLETDI